MRGFPAYADTTAFFLQAAVSLPKAAGGMLRCVLLICAVVLPAFPASADTSPPVKLAVFEFELEDFSAGAALLPANPADSEQLKHATNEARQLIAQSGRYTLVDVSGADAEAVKAHSLRNCDGCDAGIALKFGAQQSLVGIVTRISRTEYTIRFVIRDTQTGATVFNQQTGLRMGAIESWYRGAVWLIKNGLLQNPD
jgi:Protein of unknown function (DUF2380)